MPAPTLCLECNEPLAPSDIGGVCPKCLLKLGLASQLATGTLPATAKGLRDDGTIEEPFDFGDYRILRLLGKGGMGAVYEAEQRETGRRVALKVLGQSLDTPEMRQRFTREGQLAASVRHENVVAVIAADEIEAVPVISMELLHDGTLKDRVKRSGPLSPAEAVDAVLQIIAGLEAANAAGVLHRDVKPANCFISAEGEVKVGDFGLSISTLAKAEHSLTRSGTVLGTPAFAAPEQLRGEEIDARADIYAVGATLYFLLTGKPAFEEESLVALIAAVLEKTPPDVSAHRAGVPRGLRAVVRRCLAKDRGQRFRDYASLRAALAPYASVAPTPATIGLRFVAGAIDFFGTLLPLWIGLTFWQEGASHPAVGHWGAFIAAAAWAVAWFAVPEGLWARSLGKALCGLRVVLSNGQPMGMGRAFGRSLIYVAHDILPPLIAATLYSAARYEQAVQEGEWLFDDWLSLALFAGLFVTMRRRNGYAAVHDLCTGTRVVEAAALAEPLSRAEPMAAPGEVSRFERMGPYAIIARKGCVAEGFDPALCRRVWIHFVEEGTPAVSPRRREVGRSTRLRWLQGCRGAEENWDAYERPAGGCIIEKRAANEPWSTARRWLADLADELHAGMADGTLPTALSQARVWITANGRGVVLDFPAPGWEDEPARAVTSTEDVQGFLDEVAQATISPVMPLHARAYLDGLRARRFEAVPIVAGNLRALANRTAAVQPGRRLLSIVLVPLLCVLFAAIISTVNNDARQAFDAKWMRDHGGQASPRLELEVLSDLDERAEEFRPALVRRLAQEYGNALLGDEFWRKAETNELSSLGLFLRVGVEYYIAADVSRIAAGLKPPGKISATDTSVQTLLERQALRRSRGFEIAANTWYAACVILLLGVLAALIFRASPMLRVLGFAVVRSDGAIAPRWRVAARGLVAAVPVLTAAGIMLAEEAWFWQPGRDFSVAGLVTLGLICFGWMAVLLSGRGLAERVTGTWIVPR